MTRKSSTPAATGTRRGLAKGRRLGPPDLVAPTSVVRLDLACGMSPAPGFEGVDLYAEGAKHRVNLAVFPWPFADASVDEIHCSHYLEHIYAGFVDEKGSPVPDGTPGAVDALFRFMAEVWRILKAGALATFVVPSAKNDRAFQDPTHRRFFVPATFAYFARAWRAQQNLLHYPVDPDMDFEVLAVNTTCDQALNALHQQVAQKKFDSEWNAAFDYHAQLKKIGGAAA